MSYALELSNIRKTFGSLVANDDISLKVEQGTIHAVVGENGAGKSTLMYIVVGVHKPDSGTIRINGKIAEFSTPLEAVLSNIGMVYQEFMLFNEFTVWENIISGFEEMSGGVFVSKKKSIKKIRKICSEYNFNIPTEAKINELPVAVLQQVEIVKVLYRGAEIIILDEPTSVLTPQGVDGLFAALRSLKEMGKTIVFISHKLKEVFKIADKISVLRNGKLVDTVEPADINEQQLANMMVGSQVMLKAYKLPCKPANTVLEVHNLNVSDDKDRSLKRVKNVSFSVKAGEIVGIAGVAGSGQQPLIETIMGYKEPDKGSVIKLLDEDVSNKSIRERRCLGIGYVPQDRMGLGVNARALIWENAIMGYHIAKGFSSKIWLKRREADKFTNEIKNNYSVKMQSPSDKITALSGGNIQKLILGREFLQSTKLLIVEDPSRGIDVGAIEFVWKKIIELAVSGVGVLLISHDLNEVLELSDRILVMYNGALTSGGLHGEKNEYDIGLLMMGGGKPQ